jgi:hypothetical protein
MERPTAGQEAGGGRRRPGGARHHPKSTTPEDVARAQRQLTALQWVIPVLTGAVLVVNARMGEQQRPTQVTGGLVRRLLPGLWVAGS